MKKFSKFAFAAAAVIITASAFAQSVPASKQSTNDNWVNGTGEYVWNNGTNEFCWRDTFWTPGTANAKCDGALVAQAPTPPVVIPPPVPMSQKVTYQADALFDFDKATLKPAGKAKLHDLSAKIKNVNVETIIASGYTDRIGTPKYNEKLSRHRAQAVKNYLVQQGIATDQIAIEANGEKNSVTGDKCVKDLPKKGQKANKKVKECLAPDRRVVVEVIGASNSNQTN